jgi:hypothetical protein
LEDLDSSNPGLRDLQALIEDMHRLLGEANPTVATAKVMGRRALAVLAAIAGVGPHAGSSDPGSAETGRESFWK